jgi:hypothetical protein
MTKKSKELTKMKSQMKQFKFYFLLIIGSVSFAQNTTGKIKSVSENGLHKLILPATIRSASNTDLSDFRIYDSKKNEVPYFYNDNQNKLIKDSYVDFKILSETIIPKKQTTIVFENPEKNICTIDLQIANYEGEKTYSISGSNDQNQWYGLTNNNVLTDMNSENELNTSKSISFPLNNYRFLKIEFDDKKSLPISVRKIGNNHSEIISLDLLAVNYSKKTIVELISEKKTQIHILFDNKPIFDKIRFTISNPKLYKRKCTIYKLESRKVKHKFENFRNEMATFELSSDSKNTFSIYSINEKDFFIEIENLDNQPLSITNIEFFQTPVSVFADLKSNENYTIATGNKKSSAPQYDIEFFRNKVTETLPKAIIAEVNQEKIKTDATQTKSFWEQPWFMWVCICIAGLAILYFASSLIKDLKKNE